MVQPDSDPQPVRQDNDVHYGAGAEIECNIPGVQLFEQSVVIHGIEIPRLHGGPNAESAERFANDVITNLDAEILQFGAVCRVLGEVGCIQGAAGFGKTHSAERLSWLLNQNIFSANGSAAKPGDIIGKAGLKESAQNGIGFIPGWGTLALGDPESRRALISPNEAGQGSPEWLDEGGILFLDEYNASSDVVRRQMREYFKAIAEQRPRIFVPEDNYRAHSVDSNFYALVAVNEADPSNPALRKWNKNDFVSMVHFICPAETDRAIKKQRLNGLLGADIQPDNLDELRLVRNPNFSINDLAKELHGSGQFDQYCDRLFEVMNTIHQMSEKKQIGLNKSQPVYFDAIRNTDRILRFVTEFYNYNPVEMTQKALGFFYTNMFEDQKDKRAINEVIDSFNLTVRDDPDRLLFKTLAMPSFPGGAPGFTEDPAPEEVLPSPASDSESDFDSSQLEAGDLRAADALPGLTKRMRDGDMLIIGSAPPISGGSPGDYYSVKTSAELGLNDAHISITRESEILILDINDLSSSQSVTVRRATSRVSTFQNSGRIRIGPGDRVSLEQDDSTVFGFDIEKPYVSPPFTKKEDVIAQRCETELAEMLAGDSIMLGRHPEKADITIELGAVSREHVRISIDSDPLAIRPYIIEDLGSRNGTHLNGSLMTTNRTAEPSDRLRFSDIELVLPERGALHSSARNFDNADEESISEPLARPPVAPLGEESIPLDDYHRARISGESIQEVDPALLERLVSVQAPQWARDVQDLRKSAIPGIHVDSDSGSVSFMGAVCNSPDAEEVDATRVPTLNRTHKENYSREDRLLMQTIAASWELASTPCVVAGPEFNVEGLVEFMGHQLGQETYAVTSGSDPVINQFRKMIPSEETEIGLAPADGPIALAMRRGGILIMRDYEAMSNKNRIFLRDLLTARLNGKESLSNGSFPGEDKTIPIHPLFRPVIIASPVQGSTADALPFPEPDFSRMSYVYLGQQPSIDRLKAEPRLRLGEVVADDFSFEEVLNTHSAISRKDFNAMLEQSGIRDAFSEALLTFKDSLQGAASPKGLTFPQTGGVGTVTIKLGEDNPGQNVYTGDTRDDIMFLDYARVFYDGSLLKSLRQAVSYKFGNWFSSPEDKVNVRRLFQRSLRTTPMLDESGNEIEGLTLYKKLQELRAADQDAGGDA